MSPKITLKGFGYTGKPKGEQRRKHIISSTHYRINYYEIPKVGSKFMKGFFEVEETQRPINALSFKNKDVDNDYISIALVRNPWARVAGAYKYFYLTPQNKASPMVLFGRECDSFEEFVKEVIVPSGPDTKETNNHIRSQSWFLCPQNNDEEPFIHETFDLISLNSSSLFKQLMRVPNDHQFKAVNVSKGIVVWTDELRELVYKRYEDDFINFGYGELK